MVPETRGVNKEGGGYGKQGIARFGEPRISGLEV